MVVALSMTAITTATVATLVSRHLVSVRPRDRELRLRGKAFTRIVALTMCRMPDIKAASLTVHEAGFTANVSHTRADATISLSPRFIELTGSEVQFGFEVHDLRIAPRSWWMWPLVSVAHTLLGTRRLLRVGLGATATKDGVLVLATPAASVPWVGRLLAMAGSEARPRRISVFVQDGDVVLRLPAER